MAKDAKPLMEACSECADRLHLKKVGLTGSWGPVQCKLCNERQVDVIVEYDGKPGHQ